MKKCYLILAALILLSSTVLTPTSLWAQDPYLSIICWGVNGEQFSSTSPSGTETHYGCTIVWEVGDGSATYTFTGTALDPGDAFWFSLAWNDDGGSLPIQVTADTNTESEFRVTLTDGMEPEGYQSWTANHDIDWGLPTGGTLVQLDCALNENLADHDVTFTVTWGDGITSDEASTLNAIKAIYRDATR